MYLQRKGIKNMAEEEFMVNPDDEDAEGAVSKPDWKKKKVGDDERLTLRIDAIEADRWQAKRNKMQTEIKRTKTGKISKKVRQLYDDDENEDDDIMDVEHTFRLLRLQQKDVSNGDSSLLDALAPSERRMVEQRATIATMRQEENAGRLNAIEQADTLARRAGLNRSTVADNSKQMDEAIYNPRRIRLSSLESTIEKQTGIKGDIKPRTEGKVADGVKQVKITADNHKVKDVKTKDAKEVRDHNLTQNQTAELILRKSGQTAKLSEIKKQSAYNVKTPLEQKAVENKQVKEFETSVTEQSGKQQKQQEQKPYNEQVKKLLKDSLKQKNGSR